MAVVARITFMVGVLASSTVWADQLVTQETAITNTSDFFETTPTVGEDGTSQLVVYSSREVFPSGTGPGDIFLQRIDADGAPVGPPERLSEDTPANPTDDELNDVSGSRAVYTAFDPFSSFNNAIKVFDIDTMTTTTVVSGQPVVEARISGDIVVFVNGVSNAVVQLVDLSSLPLTPVTISAQGVSNVEIGDNWVVWEELNAGGDLDIRAYSLLSASGFSLSVSSAANIDERSPATDGNNVIFQVDDFSNNITTIDLVDLTNPAGRITIADNGATVRGPTISGDFVAYESDVNGNFDIFLYRISDGETFQATTNGDDQVLNDVFSDKIAFVNRSLAVGADDGGGDVHVLLVSGEVEGVPALPPAAVLLVVAVPGLVAAARRLRRRPGMTACSGYPLTG